MTNLNAHAQELFSAGVLTSEELDVVAERIRALPPPEPAQGADVRTPRLTQGRLSAAVLLSSALSVAGFVCWGLGYEALGKILAITFAVCAFVLIAVLESRRNLEA